MWFFRSPTIVFGEDALLHIREIGNRSAGERAFVVTDQAIQKSGQLAPVLFQLEHAGMQAHVFDEVEVDLTLSHIKTAAKALESFNPNWIVAVGGQHVIDAAKAMWILLENPNADLLSLNSGEPIQIGERAGLIAVPSTDGVGSATTWAITLLDEASEGVVAGTISTGHPDAVPTYAVIDPALAATLTQTQVAETGVLALAQAIESYASTWQNDFSDGLCLTAAKLVFKSLPLAFQDTSNIEAVEKVSNAAAIAGLGYSNSMIGLAYAMGRAIYAAIPEVSLARAVGICLPVVIQFNVAPDRPEDVETRYVELAKFLSVAGNDELADETADETAAADALATAVRNLFAEVQMPQSLVEAGVNGAQLDEMMDSLVDQVLSDTTIFTAPRQPTEDELRDLFDAAFGETDAEADAESGGDEIDEESEGT